MRLPREGRQNENISWKDGYELRRSRGIHEGTEDECSEKWEENQDNDYIESFKTGRCDLEPHMQKDLVREGAKITLCIYPLSIHWSEGSSFSEALGAEAGLQQARKDWKEVMWGQQVPTGEGRVRGKENEGRG